MEIIEANFDTLKFERAYVVDVGGYPEPRAVVSGVVCNIDTKPGALEKGIAFCQPVDPALVANWPIYVRFRDSGLENTLTACTVDPGVVAAARRFYALGKAARPGMAL